MTRTERWIVAGIASLFTVSFLMLGCGGKTLQSTRITQPITVDGDDAEWSSIPRRFYKDLSLSVSVAQTDDVLYFMLRRPFDQTDMTSNRIACWFDPAGKQKKYLGFRYNAMNLVGDGLMRGGARGQGGRGGRPGAGMMTQGGAMPSGSSQFGGDRPNGNRSGTGDMMGAVMGPMQRTADQIVLLRGENASPDVVKMGSGTGIQIASKLVNGVMISEFAIAMGELTHAVSLPAEPGRRISVGIETIQKPVQMMPGGAPGGGGKRGGGGRGGGMGGGPGVGPGSGPGAGAMTTTTQIQWVKVQLAE